MTLTLRPTGGAIWRLVLSGLLLLLVGIMMAISSLQPHEAAAATPVSAGHIQAAFSGLNGGGSFGLADDTVTAAPALATASANVSLPTTGTYRVVSGDTSGAIAARHGESLGTFQGDNPQIKDINLIFVGQIVNVRNGGTAVQTTAYSAPAPSDGSVGARVVQVAASHLGAAYVWGGDGTNGGYDCSGLAMVAWASVGVHLPHSARMQYAAFPHVSMSNLQLGDLVFFYPTSTGPDHVGIYAGNGMVINAETYGVPVKYEAIANMPVVGAARP